MGGSNLSFSSKVRHELAEQFGNGRHCDISELSALINICGQIICFNNYFCIKIQTENYLVAKKCFTLLKNTFNINSEILIKSGGKKRKSKVYVLLIKNTEQVERVLKATGIYLAATNGVQRVHNMMHPIVVSSVCCRRSYIRGAFISVGSVNDPEKNYHLEFVLASNELATKLRDLVNTFDLDSKVVARKDHFVVYLKEGEQIVDLLNIMGAHIALMNLENVRIIKEMRNDINRKVNCETANLNKVVFAAVKQLEDIAYIQKTIGLEKIPKQLEEVARLRLEYPDISLKELGTYLAEPVGKSGVNHRLRKISNLAETLREDKGEEL